MTRVGQTREGHFIEVSWGFHGILLGTWVFFLAPVCSKRLGGRRLGRFLKR
jgi:hypothetical protein